IPSSAIRVGTGAWRVFMRRTLSGRPQWPCAHTAQAGGIVLIRTSAVRPDSPALPGQRLVASAGRSRAAGMSIPATLLRRTRKRTPSTTRRTRMTPKNTICLWFDGTALEAATFYASIFPDSGVNAVHHAPGDYPSGKQGDEL